MDNLIGDYILVRNKTKTKLRMKQDKW